MPSQRRPGLAVAAPFALIFACGGGPLDPADEDPACRIPTDLSSTSLIEDVTVVSFVDGERRTGHSVLVRDGRIEAVDRTDAVAAPDGVVRVPGCGRTLAPGLADMHVHLSRSDLDDYLAAGVTTVRNLWGFTDLLAMQAEVEAGSLEGPTIYVISSGLDGTPAKWPFTQFVLSADDAPRVIDEQVALGYRTLKLYQDLTPDPFDAVVAAARERGLDYGGHVPHRVGLPHALASGYRFIEHLSGYELILGRNGGRGAFAWRTIDRSRIPDVVAMTVEAGTWNSPTLEIFDRIAEGDVGVVLNRQLVVKALFDAGAPLLIGTDSGIDITQPGESVHEEIGHFIEAGLSPLEALRIATVEAARFLGEEDEFGRIAPGLRADLLLVDGDPLGDPGVLAEPVMVVARGRRVH